MREAELFSRLPDVLRKAMAAPAYAERFRASIRWGHQPCCAGAPAVLRKADLPACIRPRRRSVASSRGFRLVRAAVYLAGPIFERRQRMRPLARRTVLSRPASARAT